MSEFKSHESRQNPPWPRVQNEQLPWGEEPVQYASKRQLAAARGSYSAAIPGFIADATPEISNALLTECTDAVAALTRFDAQNSAMQLPFAAVLLRTESTSSSQIENLTASAKQLALAELGVSKSENANLVVSNVKAMQAALQFAENLNGTAIIAMHRALLEDTQPKLVGSWRKEQVWIGGTPFSPHSADFVPPSAQRLPELIKDLLAFASRTDLNSLVAIAVTHAQFETIHPFEDGNGRTGRALVQAMLRAAGITKNLTVPVSAGILKNTKGYFEALTSYRNGQVEPIVTIFVNAVFTALNSSVPLLRILTDLKIDWRENLKARQDSAAYRLVELLPKSPVVNVASVVRELGVGDVTAMAAITKLVEAGILTPTSSNKRNRTWQSQDVLQALDEFGARVRRG